jgi:hypothetical protein
MRFHLIKIGRECGYTNVCTTSWYHIIYAWRHKTRVGDDISADLSTIQYNTIQYNTIQYNTIQYNTIQYNTIQYNTIQYNTSTSISISTSIFVKSVKSFRISHQLFITIPILKIYIYNNIYCY